MTSKSFTIALLGLICVICSRSDSQVQDNQFPPPVNYSTPDQSLMGAIEAVSLQTRSPIGMVVGSDYDRLCRTHAAFAIRDATVNKALQQIAEKVGYTVSPQNGVLVVLPPDLPGWESAAMTQRFESFPAEKNVSMVALSVKLTGWMRMVIGHQATFAASILSSPAADMNSFNEVKDATLSEIANRIVSLPGGGIWILRPVVQDPKSAVDLDLQAFSYLHDQVQIQKLSCGPPRAESSSGTGFQ